MNFPHWLHHLLDPHCVLCAHEKEESKVCSSCETLKMQLSIANHEKEQMLKSILEFSRKPEAEPQTPVDYEKIKPKMMTWNVRKRMLEAEDREAARILNQQRKDEQDRIKDSITELEKEVGVS